MADERTHPEQVHPEQVHSERVHPEPVHPELIRDEDPWQSDGGRHGPAHVRVWRTWPDQVIVVLSGRGAEYYPERVLPLLRAEYPDDTVEFFLHRPTDWGTLGYYAELTPHADGTVSRTVIAGDILAARLGPALYETEDPDDESTGWGGA
ncbi:hypothetical protein SAMN04487983_10299 [Streptomyces sp. yr375]|uniref:hypothetical protein n=1 Tax=Streptomyces sp. yr375 TaxID=1761906 RepID=UPI0008BC93D9|nr:hypothetical protein [Streptomyces sp. yr375]SES04590.1 hypothetical protein SAMN04487983_10299 [Streptomyces sp. yr375]